MTLLKKSLALVLTFAMIFSTMSVMGYAANDGSDGIQYFIHMNADGTFGVDDGTNGIEFAVKFFRKALVQGGDTADTSDDKYDWVETDRAAPGEAVKARVYLGTDFPTGSSINTATLFDSRFFSVSYNDTESFSPTVNKDYKSIYGLVLSTPSNGSSYRADPAKHIRFAAKTSYTKLPGVIKNDEGNVIAESYYLPNSFFDNKGMLALNVELAGKSTPVDVSDWFAEVDMNVKNDPYVRTEGVKGEASVPAEFSDSAKIYKGTGAFTTLVNVIRFPAEGIDDNNIGITTRAYDPYVKSTPGYVSVFSNVIYDAVSSEGGYFDGNLAQLTVPGVIGEDKVDVTAVTPRNDDGKVLVGWSLEKGGDILKPSELAELKYGYEDITLYAVWEESEIKTYYSYEVYNMNPDGSWPSTPTVHQIKAAENTLAEINPASAPEGFYLDDTQANILSGVVNADNSTILRAYFARKQYTATYHYTDNNGEQQDQMKLYVGQEIPAFNAIPDGIPVLPGKTFTGWSLSESSNVAVPVVMPNNDIDMYPMYIVNVYTYVYDANGGKFADGDLYKSFIYNYGEAPEGFALIPEKEGYEFSCWDIDASEAVTEDLTFTAEYNINSYSVTFVDKDGNVLYEDVFEYGTEITDEIVPAGYKKDAWTLDNGVGVKFPYTLTEDVTFTATDDANMYNVTFYVDGEVYDSYELESGSEVIVPDAPADKTGYKFIVWNPDANGAIVDEDDLEFHAVFMKGEYVLSFNTDGGTPVDPIEATYGENIADLLPGADATTKEGHTFIGWDTKLPETMPGENTEVKALWSKNIYSVKFVNGLTGAEITTVTGEFGAPVAVPELPEVAGYTFNWDVTPPANIPAKNENGDLMANGGVMTVTAVPTANDVTITFDTNGGEPETMDAIGGKANEPIDPEITEPKAPEGMEFIGWDDGTGKVIDTPTKFPAESVTLTAVYKNLKYTATYNPNGGAFADGSTENVEFEVEYGAAVPAPAAPTRENFKFIGWSPVVTTMPAKDVEFTAQWEAIGPVDYTITIYAVNPATGTYLDPIVTNHKAENGTKLQILEKGSTVPEGVTAIWYEDLYTSNSNVPDAANENNVLALEVKNGEANNLVAYFMLQEYSIVFDANGGAFNNAPADDDRYSDNQFTVTGTYGQTVELPVKPEKEDSDFIGWQDGETGYIYENEVPNFAGDVDYTAVWEKKTYDVTFTITDNEGNVLFEETVTFEHGEEVVAPDFGELEPGYAFKGWDIPEGTTAENADDYSNEAELINYDVKYVAVTGVPAGGAIPADTTKTIKDGEFEVGTATVPEGYTFEGWFINSATGSKADATYTMTAAPVTFYGEFKANTYNINYDVNGGDYLASTPVVFGTPVTTITVPTKEGNTFKGWTDAQGNLVTDETGKVLDPDFTMPAGDITLKATWEENPTFHSVSYTFNIAGIATAPATETNIQAGTTHTLAAAPADTAEYKFAGWYYNGSKVTEIVMPASDVTIIGIWETVVAKTYKLTLDANGGVFADGEATNVTEHQANASISALAAIKPTREGYTFVEWSPALPAVMPANDLTLVAQWEVEEYTINFDTDGGSTVPSMDVEFGEKVTPPADPTKPGYDFVEWSPALPETMGDIGNDGASMSVTAIWKAKEYPVILNANGGTLSNGDATFSKADVAYETVLSTVAPVGNPTRNGYKFLGWTAAGEAGYVTIPATQPIGGINYTAAWEALNNTISFDANGGQSVADLSIATGELVEEVPVTTKEGYDFAGWIDESGTLVTDKDGKFFTAFNMPSSNIKLKASWTIKSAEVKYEYTGDVPEGATPPAGGTYEYGTTVNVEAAPSAEGYKFDGWYNGNVPVAPGSTFKMGEEAVTLTGKWTKEEVKTYTVTFNAAGGQFSDGKTSWVYTLKEGDAITAPTADDVSRSGYSFVAWDSAVPSTMPAENLTFSAVWNADDTSKNLVADANGGEYSDGTTVKNHQFNAGDMVDGAIEEPTRDGYIFSGWSGLNPDGTMPAEDTTIKAEWTAKVTIDPNGGTFDDGTTAKIETTGDAIDTTGKLPVTKENAELLGWKDTISGTEYAEIPATSDVPLNLVAQWKNNEKSTIEFYVGETLHQADEYYAGEEIVLPEPPTVEGFDFEGWVLEDGSAVPATMGDTDLKAIAVLTPHKHNVTFYYDDTKADVYVEYADVAYGSEITPPADPTHPTNPELIFAGWSPALESEMPDNDLEYVATWTEKTVGKYAAHFIANGETHALHVLAEGEIIPVPADPKRFGFVFVGWEPEVPETMPGQDMTFEAQWEIDKTFVTIVIGGTVIGGGAVAGIIGAATTGAIIGGASIIGGILILWGASELVKNTYTVTYMVDGEVYKTYKVLAGTKIPVPADPTMDGSEFTGWNPEVPEKMPAEDLVFEATWGPASDIDADANKPADPDVEIPATGSVTGIAALAVISAAGALAVLVTKKKKEEDEE